jgi:hypothetical protein
MLFRTHIAVARAIPDRLFPGEGDSAPYLQTVTYTFGINADDAGDAATLAVRAGENAVDRMGEFVGGAVLELQCRCVGREEFENYKEYLLQPLDERGIFYVSGITYSGIGLQEANGVLESLQTIRNSIAKNGVPEPSFVHPTPKVRNEPKKVRIVCPVCERWLEVDNEGLLYSFCQGFDLYPDNLTRMRETGQIAGPFIKKHFACLSDRDAANALVFVYDSDERYYQLDFSKQDFG